jgi:hypothetical protein
MYKPPKREDSASLGKVKMPVETGLPPSPIIKKVLDECLAKKGVQVEQSWMESKICADSTDARRNDSTGLDTLRRE